MSIGKQTRCRLKNRYITSYCFFSFTKSYIYLSVGVNIRTSSCLFGIATVHPLAAFPTKKTTSRREIPACWVSESFWEGCCARALAAALAGVAGCQALVGCGAAALGHGTTRSRGATAFSHGTAGSLGIALGEGTAAARSRRLGISHGCRHVAGHGGACGCYGGGKSLSLISQRVIGAVLCTEVGPIGRVYLIDVDHRIRRCGIRPTHVNT